MLNRLEQSGGRQQGLLCLSRARGSSWTATASVSSSGAISCYEWLMKSRSEESSSNSLPQAELSSMGELVLIIVGFCPWVHTAMQGKICFLPLRLHPAEPCVSVELCWPAESRVFYQSFTRATCSLFWPHSGIPPLLFQPKVLHPDLQHVLLAHALQFSGTVAQEGKIRQVGFLGSLGWWSVSEVGGEGDLSPFAVVLIVLLLSLSFPQRVQTTLFQVSVSPPFAYCGWFVSVVSRSLT